MTGKGTSLKESYYHQKMDPLKSLVRLEAAVNTLLLQCCDAQDNNSLEIDEIQAHRWKDT